jgi:excisionase family DNA binding protein
MQTNTDDKSREQAANFAANSDEQATNGGERFAAQWLTVAEVADLLGVTPRTIQKRCKAGKLDARSVETPTGDQWEINAANVETKRTEAANEDANRATKGDEQAANSSQPQDADERARIAGRDATPPDWKERETELKEQIQWLKSQIEDANRNAAELRAALRKALEIAPRQLPAGTPTDGQQRAQSGAANNVPSATPSGPQEPAQRDRPLTYADIADEIERTLNP